MSTPTENIVPITPKHDAAFDAYETIQSIKACSMMLQDADEKQDIDIEQFRFFVEATNDLLLYTLGWLLLDVANSGMQETRAQLVFAVQGLLGGTLPLPTTRAFDLVGFGTTLAELAYAIEVYATAIGVLPSKVHESATQHLN